MRQEDVQTRSDRTALTKAWGAALDAEGFVLVSGPDLVALLPAADLARLEACWEQLELDDALIDGGSYRYRRYGRLRADRDASGNRRFTPLPHAAFRQSAAHIPDYGGRERLFSPIAEDVLRNPALVGLVAADLDVVERVTNDAGVWEVGLHLVRVIAVPDEPGNPTPEGRHSDGHDFVGMHLFGRANCMGGKSIVYREGREPVSTTLTDRLDSLIVADQRLTHEATPVTADGGVGVRDMLLVDLNAR
jgi:hypothetical protein